MEKGYIHIYTGDGKGKTTAAFGLAVRALCAGKSVYIGQFVKSMQYNETRVTEKFDRIRIEQFGNGCMLTREAVEDDVRMARMKDWSDVRRYFFRTNMILLFWMS